MMIMMIIVGLVGCAVRYSVRPEISAKLFQVRKIRSTFKYYKRSMILPYITRSEIKNPDSEELQAGSQFLFFLIDELKKRGFELVDSPPTDPFLDVEIDFAYKKPIPFLFAGAIAARMRASLEGNLLFEITDYKELFLFTGIPSPEIFTQKARVLAGLLSERFAEELGAFSEQSPNN